VSGETSIGLPFQKPLLVCGSVREFFPSRGREDAFKDIKRKLMIAGLTASSVGLLFQVAVTTSPAQPSDAALIAKARGIHDRVLKLDTHNDIEPSNFTADCNYTMRLTTQVNLPKMIEGGMDVSFMIVYVGQGALTPEGFDAAYGQAVAKFDAIHRLTEKIAPDQGPC
jgi:membrane dipeptidase